MIPALPFVLLFLRSQICNLKKAQICDERLESRAVAIGRKMAISLSEMERFKPERVQRQLVGATVCLIIGANLQVSRCGRDSDRWPASVLVGGWSRRRSHLIWKEKLLCEMDDASVLSVVRNMISSSARRTCLDPLVTARWAPSRPVASLPRRVQDHAAGGGMRVDPHMGYTAIPIYLCS